MKQIKKIISIFLAMFISLSLFAESSEIKTLKLKNNIPVYIKNDDSNQIVTIYIVVNGGVALLPTDKSGLENALFAMMTRGSKRYSYSKIKTLEYNTESSISPMSINEGSAIGLTCIDYYLDEMLPVLINGFLYPTFDETEYNNLMNEYKQKLQSIENDPFSSLQYNIERTVYKNHPYETSVGVIKESLKNITIENMKDLHSSILDTNRISVVAVGNIDQKELIKKLDTTLGSIPQNKAIFKSPSIPSIKVSGEPVISYTPAAEGTGYYAEVFSAPSIKNDDYFAASICAEICKTLLFNIVREKYGACYSPICGLESSQANYGAVIAYKVSDMKNIGAYIKEAENLLKEGKLISSKNDDGTYSYSTIQDEIEGYKNSYLNSTYEGMQTNSGVASRIAGSILQFDNPREYLDIAKRVKAVSVEDIEKVLNKYWLSEEKQLFAVVAPSAADDVKDF